MIALSKERRLVNQNSIAIVGLGYVGLTLAVALARAGHQVFGIEVRGDVVDLTNEGKAHFSETGLEEALGSVVRSGRFKAFRTFDDVPACSYYIITVGTPLRPGTREPRLDMIQHATRDVADHFPDDAVVILRSTVKVGTTRNVVQPILESSGRRFHLAMCPERTLEGDALRELNILPQIVGGIDGDSMRRAADLFSSLTKTLVEVRDPETAELIKLIDNTSRDVRFAFGNEVARICDGLGVNAYDVIHYGQLGYERTSVAYPGLVGGPCLEKDPHILQSSVADLGLELDIANAVRLVNERQPAETVESVLNAVGKSSGISVLVSGIAFKGRPETDDLRGSMGLRVFEQVCRDPRVGRVLVHDAVVSSDALAAVCPNAEVSDRLEPALASADLMLITNNHPFYSSPTFSDLLESSSKRPLVYDYWNNLRGSMAFQAIEGYTFLGNFKGFGNA